MRFKSIAISKNKTYFILNSNGLKFDLYTSTFSEKYNILI